MAVPQYRGAPAWSVRLAADLDANDQAARKLVAELTEEQLNWQPAPGSWSVGQCLAHLSITNEAYLPAISVAVNGKPNSPVEQITPGWCAPWFQLLSVKQNAEHLYLRYRRTTRHPSVS